MKKRDEYIKVGGHLIFLTFGTIFGLDFGVENRRKANEKKKKNRLNVWYVCAALSKLPSIIGWTHTYTLKNTHIYITTASIQEQEYVEYSKNKHKKKFRNTTTGNTSHTQVKDNCLIIL